ncbi:MAG: efflux transporter outer membrane subunit [Methyloprofundus sp.]|nr:efflux transporter outer membrane subunit [Methyloprofundus sp.]
MPIKYLLLCSLSLLLTACAVPIEELHSPITPPTQFSQTGEAPLQDRWWLAFNDPELNQLIELALANNFTLAATFDRLRLAEALSQINHSELIPSVSAVFGGRQNYSNLSDSSQFSLGLVASYEVDLWGRIRAQNQAANLDVRVAQENIGTAAISLSAEVAIAWYRLIEQRSQLALLNQQIATNQDNVDITIARFAGAQSTAADLFQQQQTLEARKGDRYHVLANIKVLEHQLAILTGNTPEVFTLPDNHQLPALPDQPKTGLGIALLQRRPDIRLAYFKVQAADQRVASAIADRYPKLSLSANVDTLAPNLQSLFNNWIATLAGNLLLPIIDGGRRVAEVDRNKALAAESLNIYAATTLEAIKEVEDTLSQEQQQRQLVTSLDEQYTLSKLANEQIRLRYMYGSMDFLRLLTVQINLQSLDRNRLAARRQLIEYRISLYRALAGGWYIERSSE